MAKEKIYPVRIDLLLCERAREAGVELAIGRCLWSIPGPKNTDIAWIECWPVGAAVVIVETFKSGGWNAFSPCQNGDITATLNDVIERCQRKMK